MTHTPCGSIFRRRWAFSISLASHSMFGSRPPPSAALFSARRREAEDSVSPRLASTNILFSSPPAKICEVALPIIMELAGRFIFLPRHEGRLARRCRRTRAPLRKKDWRAVTRHTPSSSSPSQRGFQNILSGELGELFLCGGRCRRFRVASAGGSAALDAAVEVAGRASPQRPPFRAAEPRLRRRDRRGVLEEGGTPSGPSSRLCGPS